MEVIFWISLILVAYTLIGYPVIANLLAIVARRDVQKQYIEPRISFIIAAYNEETSIAEKLEQTLALDYPPDQLEIIVADDGSSDRTPEIVRSFGDRGVIHFRSDHRAGKTDCLNRAAAIATGEILVFSDATGVFDARSLRELASHFADPDVGCVSGRVAYRYGKDLTSGGFRVYQRVVVGVRRAEGAFGSVTSVSGAIHAVRASVFRPTDPTYTQDLADAIHTVVQGKRVSYEYDAIAWEDSRASLRSEFESRIRICVREHTMLAFIIGSLVRARRWMYLFQMFSHKFLRWWLWAPLVMLLVSSLALAGTSPLHAVAAALQIAFYLGGIAAIWFERAGRRIPGTSPLAFFVAGNAAMCIGLFRWLRKGAMPTWNPIR